MSECAWCDHTAIQAHCIHLNPWVQNQAVYPHWGCVFVKFDLKAAEYSGQFSFRELNKLTHRVTIAFNN